MTTARPAVDRARAARGFWQAAATWLQTAIALLALLAIAAHLVMRFSGDFGPRSTNAPLLAALVLGGIPLLIGLVWRTLTRGFGSDLLAGISILTSIWLEEYLAGSLVVLMLSGGEALENYATRSASSVLDALARRSPSQAHRRQASELVDVALDDVAVGDRLTVLPHETCPVDGVVVEGHGVMDESYLTGEPFLMSKAPGAEVLSGAINGDAALDIEARRLAVDSRYAKIMRVMLASEQQRPRLRRLGDQLGAWYTPLAVSLAAAAWWASGDAGRFLAVLVVATPCPLLIGIPVAIIGAISLAARHSIIIKDPAVLEQIERCQTFIFDKTGTLTYGRPRLVSQEIVANRDAREILVAVASLERYSKHPLSMAVAEAAADEHLPLATVSQMSERPGEGLRGHVNGYEVWITNRKQIGLLDPSSATQLPPTAGGLECCIAIDGKYVATYRFRDEPRQEGASFVRHLPPKHHVHRILLVSGDRESEVRYLADRVGIELVYGGQSPEQKLAIVRAEVARAPTLFVGDGINDAPALAAATVGVAFGPQSDIAAEAAGAVILDSSLEKVDRLLHIGARMRAIALQSAVGGMLLSLAGMALAAAGYLPPVAGAIFQEVIDLAAVLNALRVALPGKPLSDF